MIVEKRFYEIQLIANGMVRQHLCSQLIHLKEGSLCFLSLRIVGVPGQSDPHLITEEQKQTTQQTELQ